jgi:hypothetical protein
VQVRVADAAVRHLRIASEAVQPLRTG